jgi:hypothetical protein
MLLVREVIALKILAKPNEKETSKSPEINEKAAKSKICLFQVLLHGRLICYSVADPLTRYR